MPVRPQAIEFPLAGGIDTKSDEKVVSFPSFLDIKNAVFTSHGSLKKRNGYTALDKKDKNETAISGKKGLAKKGSQLLATGDGQLHTYSSSVGRWADRGNLPQWEVTSESIADRPVNQTQPCVATDGTIRLSAWLEGTTCFYQIQDTSGAVLQAPTSLSTTAAEPRAIHTKSGVLLFIRDTGAQDIWAYHFSTSNYTGTKTEYQLADFHSDYLWDVCSMPGPLDGTADPAGTDAEGGAAVTYKDSTNNGLRTIFLEASGIVSLYDPPVAYNPGTYSQGDTENFITSRFSGVSGGNVGHVYVMHATGTTTDDTRYIRCDANGYSSVAGKRVNEDVKATEGSFTFQQAAASGGDNSTSKVFVYEEGTTIYSSETSGYTEAVLTGTTRFNVTDLCLTSHLARYSIADDTEDTDWFFLLHYSSTLQKSFLLVDSSFEVIGVYETGLAGEESKLLDPKLNGTVWEAPIGVKKRVEVVEAQVAGFSQKSVKLLGVDVSGNYDKSFAELRGSTYIGGTSLWQFDGTEVVESGFWHYPEVAISPAGVTVSGATLDYDVANEPYTIDRTDGSAGSLTFVYYVVYEWTDSQGKLIQSTAIPFTMTNAINPSTDNVSITIPQIPATWKSSVRAAVYRTHNDSTAIAYRLSGYPGDDVTSSSATFTDNVNEDTLKTGEILYLSTGSLDHVAPYATTIVHSHDDRLFYVDSQDPLKVRFSKRPSDFDQPGFNEGLFIQVPPDGGDVSGLANLDNKLVIFKRDRVYMVSGDGPNGLGVGSYSLPRLVSTDTGCKDSASIVRVPQGVMFQSDKGIYWLNRGEAVNYIGAPVEAYNSEVIKAATLLPDKNLVIFITEGNRTLAFDYERGFWTTFTNHDGLGAVAIDDGYYYLRSDGCTVYQMDSSFLDESGSIAVEVTTPWIKPDGLQKRWHCYRAAFLGNYLSTHDISVDVYTNYKSYRDYTKTWNPESALDQGTLGGNATLGGGDAFGINDATKPDQVYQFAHILRNQRIQSVKFVVTEIPPGSTPGASFELTSLALEAAGYGDVFKLPGSKVI